MNRLERDRKAALAASEAAQRKQKQINQEHTHEHDTPAPSAPSIPPSPRRSGEHHPAQPQGLGPSGAPARG